MKASIKKDIKKVIDMYWADEQIHFLANRGKDHIYLVLRRLKKYLERNSR